MILTFAPIMRPIARQLSAEELRASLHRNIAGHEANLNTFTTRGDVDGIRVAERGIKRCSSLLSLLVVSRQLQ